MPSRGLLIFYERRVFPWLNDNLSANPELTRMSAELLASASDRVTQIGFGTGANLDMCPREVNSVVAVEPKDGTLDHVRS